jgi:hypothetical protein
MSKPNTLNRIAGAVVAGHRLDETEELHGLGGIIVSVPNPKRMSAFALSRRSLV